MVGEAYPYPLGELSVIAHSTGIFWINAELTGLPVSQKHNSRIAIVTICNVLHHSRKVSTASRTILELYLFAGFVMVNRLDRSIRIDNINCINAWSSNAL